MQVVAITNFYFGLGSDEEVIQRGQFFTPPGTGQMNRVDHAKSLIAQGSCCIPEDWPKIEARTQAGWDWARAEVARMNASRR